MPVLGPANLGPNFYPKLVQIASELQMKPEDILAIMVSESGINPSAYEDKYKGAGLVGFMPDTLKGLGFKGDWHDFASLLGEQQLDYVKKLIQNNSQFNGGPFTSAAQYYVANFFPVALKLPGIKHNDPNTVFLEQDPEIVQDKKTGRKYSKKYFDIGYKIDPGMEKSAYKGNPLFHGSVPGAITFGDMMRQVNKNKSTGAYKNALKMMEKATNYSPSNQSNNQPSTVVVNNNVIDIFINRMTNFLKHIAASDQKSYLISIGAKDLQTQLEYAKILNSVIKEELKIKSEIYTNDNNKVEIECYPNFNNIDNLLSLNEVSNASLDTFNYATKSIGDLNINVLISQNSKSTCQELDIKTAELNHRMFKYKFITLKNKGKINGK